MRPAIPRAQGKVAEVKDVEKEKVVVVAGARIIVDVVKVNRK